MDNLGVLHIIWRIIKWPVVIALALLLTALLYYATLIVIVVQELGSSG